LVPLDQSGSNRSSVVMCIREFCSIGLSFDLSLQLVIDCASLPVSLGSCKIIDIETVAQGDLVHYESSSTMEEVFTMTRSQQNSNNTHPPRTSAGLLAELNVWLWYSLDAQPRALVYFAFSYHHLLARALRLPPRCKIVLPIL
jgi:hypothetical protein